MSHIIQDETLPQITRRLMFEVAGSEDDPGLDLQCEGTVTDWIVRNDGPGKADVWVAGAVSDVGRRVTYLEKGQRAFVHAKILRLRKVSFGTPETDKFAGAVTAFCPGFGRWECRDEEHPLGITASGRVGVQSSYWVLRPPGEGAAFSVGTAGDRYAVYAENETPTRDDQELITAHFAVDSVNRPTASRRSIGMIGLATKNPNGGNVGVLAAAQPSPGAPDTESPLIAAELDSAGRISSELVLGPRRIYSRMRNGANPLEPAGLHVEADRVQIGDLELFELDGHLMVKRRNQSDDAARAI